MSLGPGTLQAEAMATPEASRTLVVCGVPDLLPSFRMVDKLFIHFQRARSCGGDVQAVQYPTNVTGVAFVTFDSVEDAERVLTEDQLMEDREFPAPYPLTVFRFTPDVFFFVSAEVDLSAFRDPHKLIRTLQETHRSARVIPLPSGRGVTVEGPFLAVRELRKDLMKRAQVPGDRGLGTSPESRVPLRASPSRGAVGGTWECSTFVDATVFSYIQRLHGRDLNRCLRKYPVEMRSEEQGDLTLVTLSGRESASLGTALSELELLVATKQSTLRMQKIDCCGNGGLHENTVLSVCRHFSDDFGDILLFPLESGVAVVGPSASVHSVCALVEDRVRALGGSLLPSRAGASREESYGARPVSHVGPRGMGSYPSPPYPPP